MTSHFRDTAFRNAPNDPRMTLNPYVSEVPCVHWILTHEAQISISFTLRPAIFEIQACRKSESTEWPQNALNHWSVKSTLYTRNTHTRGPNFTLFRSTISHFRDTGFSKIRNEPNDPTMTLSTYVSKVPCVHWILTPRPKFHSVSLYGRSFSR